MGKPLNLLIVEDSEDDAFLILAELKKGGYSPQSIRVDTEKAMKEALEKQSWDVVLADYNMPQFSAPAALKLLKTFGFNIPFIIVSGVIGEETAVSAMKLGAHDYIMKGQLTKLVPVIERELREAEIRRERRKVEEILEQERRLMQYVLNNIPDPIFFKDTKSRFTRINTAQSTMLGIDDPKKAIGKTDSDYFLKEHAEDSLKDEMDIIKTGKPVIDKLERIKRVDGVLRWVLTSKIPIVDSQNKISGIVGVTRDITDLKQAEEDLRENEELLRLVIDMTPNAIYVKDKEGKYLVANRLCAEWYGTTPKEMIGKTQMDLFNGSWCTIEEIKKMIEDDREVIEKNAPKYIEEEKMTKSNGSIRWLQTTKIPLALRGEQGYLLGVSVDITDRKNAEEMQEKTRAQLLQAQKMEAIGILAGGIAHDFNNLLTAIQGSSDMAIQKADRKDSICIDLEEIQSAAVRAADLTRQLLMFSRKQPMEFQPIDLNTTVRSLLKLIHRLIGEDIRISTSFDPSLCIVMSDKGSLEQAVMNLAVNARDAMPEGGRLVIRTKNVELSEEEAEVMPEARPGSFVRLSVIDKGTGMDKETAERIFEPFFSTKSHGKGTGLGLSVVYGIIKQHDGWIQVASSPGSGSTFDVYLPAITDSPHKDDKHPVSAVDLKGNGERVLVVEDEQNVRRFIVKALGKHGYKVMEASNVKDALNIFEKEKKAFSLVFSDVVLPDKSGIQLIQTIQKKNKKVKFILSSGYTDKKSRWETIHEMGIPFLQKPYSLIELLQNIKNALG